MNYILVLISVVLLALEFAVQKKYQSLEGASAVAGLKFNSLHGLVITILAFLFSGCKVEFSLFSFIMATCTALLAMTYSVIGFFILRSAGMAIYSVFLMIGGMLLPYFYGVLFLDELLSLYRVIGVVLIIAAIILVNKTKYAGKVTIYLLCAAVFVLNGGVSILSKCHQINTTYPTVSSVAFTMYMGIAKFVFGSFAVLLFKGKGKVAPFASRSSLVWIVVAALFGGASYILQLIGAKELPAVVLYPLVTGGSIILSTLSGMVFYKEKLSAFQLISVAICFVGTLLFLF